MNRSRLPLSATAGALAVSLAMPAGAAAVAQSAWSARAYCPTRPGLGTTPCTIAPGHVSVEITAGDLEHDRDRSMRRDTLLVGDLFVRLGVDARTELFAGWTPDGTLWTRVGGGVRSRETGMGDITLGAKFNLVHPDGTGLSVAVAPFLGVPVGCRTFGAGGWNGGVQVPASVALSEAVSLQLTPEFDMAADRDGRRRHPAYSVVASASVRILRRLTGAFELSAARNHDPQATTVQTSAAVALGYMPSPRLQLDTGVVLGIGGTAADARGYVGLARLF